MSRIVVLIFICISWVANAQDVTIINNYNGDEGSVPITDFVLKSVTEHTYIVNEFEPSNTGERSRVQQMISYGLRSHVDNKFHVFDGRIEILENPIDFQIAIKAIVQNAIWIHDLSFYNAFEGFSPSIAEQVKDINKIDGYKISTAEGNRDLVLNGSIGLYTFQRMVYEVKLSLELEVNLFLDSHMPRGQEKGYDEPATQYLSSGNYQLPNYNQNDQELLDMKLDIDIAT